MTLNIEEVSFSPSTDFFKRTSSFHGECSKKSLDFLFKTDAVLVNKIEKLDELLDKLERLSTCFWGCKNPEHIIENLTGKSVSYFRASFNLLITGHYDESLSV